MPKLTVDNIEVEVAEGCNLLQACEAAGVEIPRFCYHESLSVAGNCRMCLVQVEKMPKPIASCAMPAASGMVVHTNNDFIRKARQAVMEFLLINHPLDCPICDQGGECDLQDQSYIYGLDKSRFALNKRAVEDKYIGPLVKTVMNRCIHCTRCVRFSAEVAGASELGATGRGEDMLITTYLETAMQSELSGNVIDLCPVGALTSKPYQFKARSWELQKTETIDVMDAMAMPVRIDSRGREILRILPREDDRFDETWISDKTRFVYDAFKSNRLDRAYVRQKENRRIEVDYLFALDLVAKQMKGETHKKAFLVGDLNGAEEIFALKKLTDALSIGNRDCRLKKSIIDPRVQGENIYRFNSGFDAIDEADQLLLIGTNPRYEAPVLNASIRKKWLKSSLEIATIGEKNDLTYPAQHLGQTADVLTEIANGKHPYMRKLASAKKPLLIISEASCTGQNGKAILAAAIKIAKNCNALPEDQKTCKAEDEWFGFNMLTSRIGVNAALNMQFLPEGKEFDTDKILKAAAESEIDTLYLLGYDDLEQDIPKDVCVIYQGSHGGKAAKRADIILPSACYVEKNSIYLNAETRALNAYRAVFPLGEAREDWAVIRALAEKMDVKLGFNSLEQLRDKLYQEYPDFKSSELPKIRDTKKLLEWADKNLADIAPMGLPNVFDDFYLSNLIAQNSSIMRECSDLRKKQIENSYKIGINDSKA